MAIGHVKYGNGPERVLVMHDWSCDHTNYHPVLPYLDQARFTYLFVDLRGYGMSRNTAGKYTVDEVATDCLEVVDLLGWRNFHVVGHSMTGMVTQRIAADAPTRVKSAIAICPVSAAGFPLDEESWNFFVSATEEDGAYRELMRGVCSGMLSDGWLNEKLRRNRAATAPECRKGYLQMFSKTNFANEVQGLTTPYLVVVGEYDHEGLNEKAVKTTFLSMHPNSELAVIRNCGHYPMQECPPYFAKVLEEFLNKHAV
jgi:3-oxoadipate enol-lactonase